MAIWEAVSGYPHPPEACLVNWYAPGARMGLHQDRDEADFSHPVLSRKATDEEYEEAREAFFQAGLHNGWQQDCEEE